MNENPAYVCICGIFFVPLRRYDASRTKNEYMRGHWFKTIVLEGDKTKHFVCVVPGACEVDTIVINNDS